MLGISTPDLLVLALAALFILGPERLPGAASWLGRTVRKARDSVSTAHEQLRSEVGTEFDEFRQPLRDLAKLRDIDPRRVLTRHLLDEPDAGDRPFGFGYPAVPDVFDEPAVRPKSQVPHVDYDAT